MATQAEKSWIEGLRQFKEGDFDKLTYLDLKPEGSSLRSLLARAGFDYRTARYLLGIMEDTERLVYIWRTYNG